MSKEKERVKVPKDPAIVDITKSLNCWNCDILFNFTWSRPWTNGLCKIECPTCGFRSNESIQEIFLPNM